jgi:hypothetical protein
MEDDVLDQVSKATFARSPFGKEATLVPHEQSDTGLVSPSRHDGVTQTVPEPPLQHRPLIIDRRRRDICLSVGDGGGGGPRLLQALPSRRGGW